MQFWIKQLTGRSSGVIKRFDPREGFPYTAIAEWGRHDGVHLVQALADAGVALVLLL